MMKAGKKIAFIGDMTAVEFFKVFGAQVFAAHSADEADKIIAEMNFEEYAMVFITEDVFERERFEKLIMNKQLLVIPGLKEGRGEGYKMVEELISKATGMAG